MGTVRNGAQALGQLNAIHLHRLAVALGSACSGSKSTVVDSITEAVSLASSNDYQAYNHSASSAPRGTTTLSIVSIDMGIQNLAYAHLLAPHPKDMHLNHGQQKKTTRLPILRAWERLAVFPEEKQEISITKSAKANSYCPSRYAMAAHHFVTEILRKYEPTHILIEQQRFRSGGNSAVAEWTLRVGVFEGMLHAILRTLREERKNEIRLQAVASISPARTARFWLGGSGEVSDQLKPRKITGREGKQAKIDIVGRSFLNVNDRLVKLGTADAIAMGKKFSAKWHATSKVAKVLKSEPRISPPRAGADRTEVKHAKLDDLADCLLQGIAWLEWQRMRALVFQDLNAKEPIAAVQTRLASLLAENMDVPKR
jgi:cruciform cutting endonuclease 1